MKLKTKRVAHIGLCTAAALILAYVETLIPPIFTAIPGIKLGLPNIAIIFALYSFGLSWAAVISFVRIVAVALLFGNSMTFAYSVAGAFLSLLVMAVLRKLGFFSEVGVSVCGGVFHNVGQILTAMLLLETTKLGYYLIILAITGTVSGVLVGICSGILLKRIVVK